MRYGAMLFAAAIVAAGCEGSELSGTDIKTCTSATAYTIGSTVTGTVDANDCKDGQGAVGDIYSFSTTGATGFNVNFSGTGFKPNVIFYQGTIANMGAAKVVADVDASEFPTFKVIVPAGSYFFTMTSENASGGNYTLSTTNSGATATGCPLTFAAPGGLTITGTITPQDCAGGGGSYHDIYIMNLTSGQSVNFSGSIDRGGGFFFRVDDTTSPDLINKPINVATGGSTTMSYTATASRLYRVHVWSTPQFNPAPANYTLSF